MTSFVFNKANIFLDGNGDPIPGALIYFFEAGTTTPATTYSDAELTVARPHPVVANAEGRVSAIYLADGSYDVRISTAGGATVTTVNNVQHVSDILGRFQILTDDKITDQDEAIEARHLQRGSGGSLMGIPVSPDLTEHPRPVSTGDLLTKVGVPAYNLFSPGISDENHGDMPYISFESDGTFRVRWDDEPPRRDPNIFRFSDYTISRDSMKLIQGVTGSADIVVTIPDSDDFPAGTMITFIWTGGTGSARISPPSGGTINGSTSDVYISEYVNQRTLLYLENRNLKRWKVFGLSEINIRDAAAGQIPRMTNSGIEWISQGNFRSEGGNTTLVKSDAGGFVDLFGSGNANITIPANVFANGDRITIARQGGAGVKTLVPATGTTLNDGTSGIALTTTVGQEAYLRVNGSNGNEFWLSQ